jgi:hypothetical protein
MPPFGGPALSGTFAMSTGYESAPRGGRNNLEQVIDGLEQRLDELATAQRQTRLLVLGGSLLLMGLMSLFGLRLYSTLQRQLNATQLQNALMAKVNDIWPPLSQKFTDSAMKAAPVYGEQALQRFEKVRPQLEGMLLKETEQFAEQLQASLLKKSEAGMQRVTEKVTQDLKRQLPKLTETKLDSIEENSAAPCSSRGAASPMKSRRRLPRRRFALRSCWQSFRLTRSPSSPKRSCSGSSSTTF